MSTYFIIYGILWSCAIIGLTAAKNNIGILYKIQSYTLVLFIILKYETGYDWPVYEKHYNGTGTIPFEPGYEILVYIFRSIGIEFKYFYSIIGGIIALSIIKIIEKISLNHKTVVLAIAYSIPDFFIIPTFSIIRQAIASVIIAYGVILMLENKPKKATIVILSSILFHVSSIIMLAYFFTAALFIHKRKIFTIFIILFFSIFYLASYDLFGNIIQIVISKILPNFTIYTDKDTFNASIVYKVTYLLITAAAAYLILTTPTTPLLSSTYLANQRAKTIALIGLITPIILFNQSTFNTRVLTLTGILIASYCAMNAINKLTHYKLLLSLITPVLFILPIYRFLSSPLSVPFIPYQSIIFYNSDNSSGQERTAELIEMLMLLW